MRWEKEIQRQQSVDTRTHWRITLFLFDSFRNRLTFFVSFFPPLPLHDKNSSRHPPLTIPNTIASPSCIKSSRSERRTRGGRWVSAQSKFDIYNRFTFHLVPYYASSLSLLHTKIVFYFNRKRNIRTCVVARIYDFEQCTKQFMKSL